MTHGTIASSLSTPRLHRCVELNGEDVGLSVPRIEVPADGRVYQGPANSDLTSA